MGNRIERVLIVGPLAVFANGFTAELERLGYSPFTAVEQLRLMAHLSRWMEERGSDVTELTPARASAFLADRRACGHAHRCSPRALDPLLAFGVGSVSRRR
jgi:integrase/recombinase XerD